MIKICTGTHRPLGVQPSYSLQGSMAYSFIISSPYYQHIFISCLDWLLLVVNKKIQYPFNRKCHGLWLKDLVRNYIILLTVLIQCSAVHAWLWDSDQPVIDCVKIKTVICSDSCFCHIYKLVSTHLTCEYLDTPLSNFVDISSDMQVVAFDIQPD